MEDHAEELLAYLKTEFINTDSITFLPHTYSPDDLISDRVFAISAYVTDEPYLLKEKGIDYNIFNPRSSGIDFYGDVLFTSEYENEFHQVRVKRFLDASLKGWEYAINNETEIVDIIYNKYSKRHSKQHLLFEANQTKRLIMPDVVEIGYINKNRWQRIGEIYSELNMLPSSFSMDGFIFNRNPKQDLSSLYYILLLSFVVVFLISFVAVRFYRLNMRLKLESIEKNEREKKLILLEERYRNLAKYVPVPIFITSAKSGDILYINKQASDKFELNEDYAKTKNARDLYVNVNDREKILNTVYNQGYIREEEVLMKSAGGEQFWAIVTSNVIIFDDTQALFSAVLDISEQKRLLQKLESANAYKDKLFSIISHDLKGPIGTLNSFLDILVNKKLEISDDEQNDILIKFQESSKTTYELLDNLLLWSLNQKDKLVFNPQPNNLCELINANLLLVSSSTEKKKIQIINNCRLSKILEFDYDMINVVIRNLISNAIKYSRQNEVITIRVEQEAGEAVFSIEDHGLGINESRINTLFEFEKNTESMIGTSGEKGTGLGLTLCFDFIKLHKGKIWVNSKLGIGSTFYFSIPTRK